MFNLNILKNTDQNVPFLSGSEYNNQILSPLYFHRRYEVFSFKVLVVTVQLLMNYKRFEKIVKSMCLLTIA